MNKHIKKKSINRSINKSIRTKSIRKKSSLLSFLLILSVSLLLFAGCSKSKDAPEKGELAPSGSGTSQPSGDGSAKNGSGAYLEEEVALPEAVEKGEMGIDSILIDPEGELVLYASFQDIGTDQKIRRYVLQPDDTWKEETESWMGAVKWTEERMAIAFSYDPNGNFYITALTHTKESENGEEWGNEFYRVKAGENEVEKLDLKIPEEALLIRTILAGADGKVITQPSAFPSNVFVFDLESGKSLYEFSREKGCPIWYGNQVLTLEGGGSRLLYLNGDTGETEATVTIQEEADVDGYFSDGSSLYAEVGKGVWLAGMDGLLYLAEGGSKWEVLLDAGQSVMGMPSYHIENLLKAGEQTFYLQYVNGINYQNGLVRIRYQEGISAERDKVVTIYSLEESDSIRQAVVEFQREHLDVRVEYRAVMGENSSATREDCIQALNTELLAGKGADLIVTDSLPADAYIEHGILADLSELADSLVKEGLLMGNIAEAVREDTLNIYSIPTHMMVPIWIGSEEALRATESIETLAAASAQAEFPYFGRECYDYELLFELLYARYGDKLIQNGEASQERIAGFLNSYLTLAGQSAVEEKKVYLEQSSVSSTYGGNGELGAFDIWLRMYLMEPELVIRETGYGYVTARDSFVPVVNLAVNNACKQPELAYEFIRKMLAVSIQEADLDALPVNPEAVAGLAKNRQENVMTGMDYYALLPDGSQELRQIVAECPTEEEIQAFTDKLGSLKRIQKEEEHVKELLEAEIPALWRGERTVEAASAEIYQKLKNYLAE